ncbi:MAG TPA: hypothetical protein PLG50_00055 [bacterium]|nr:hypothetical protein [bacterium]HQG44031.1 hypothetical protein [bacterium]HQJ65688.1 hypothetical protein [bacterium]
MQTLIHTPHIQLSARVRPAIPDPALVMSAASRRAGKWFAQLEEQHHITAAEVMEFLATHEPAVREKLETLRAAVDDDIYGRYLEGVLDSADYRLWRRNLHAWLSLLHAALALVRLRFGFQIESDFALPLGSTCQPLPPGPASAAA